MNINNTVQHTKELITAHDLTHGYSDDNGTYTRGVESYTIIIDLMNEMTEDQKVECRVHWNDEVRKKIAPKMQDLWLIQGVQS